MRLNHNVVHILNCVLATAFHVKMKRLLINLITYFLAFKKWLAWASITISFLSENISEIYVKVAWFLTQITQICLYVSYKYTYKEDSLDWNKMNNALKRKQKMWFLTQPHVRLRDLYNYISVAYLNHSTLHEAESIVRFSTETHSSFADKVLVWTSFFAIIMDALNCA